jgi:hypothetical protein
VRIIALGQDDTPNQRLEHTARGQQVLQRPQRPSGRRVRRSLEIGPRRRDQRAAVVRQHEDQLEPAAAPHPAHQRERAALQWMTRPHDPHLLREAVEVGSVSCLPLIASGTTR